MNTNTLWSLRLGFSNKQAAKIQSLGLDKFLEQSFDSTYDTRMPSFLNSELQTLKAYRDSRKSRADNSELQKKLLKKENRETIIQLRKWWIDKMRTSDYPLREKMVCFWHNHFVATSKKVKLNYWVYQHNMILRANAFGNFRELTKKIVKSNAMVWYLDNVKNRRKVTNENLSRELLELFTLGEGNYSEADIKNGAKGLAGLGVGMESAVYRDFFTNNETIEYFGKTGIFRADDLVNIIFEQKNSPYLLTRKILKWFIYDNPPQTLVTYYGDYLRQVDFEIRPFLKKIFTEEFPKDTAGSKIKDPLVYILQLLEALQLHDIDSRLVAYFLKMQQMDLFNQPNVKGWDGGKSWLTAQLFINRNRTSDLLCSGRGIKRKELNRISNRAISRQNFTTNLDWNRQGDNRQIIKELADKLVFKVDEKLQYDMESVLTYDFDPQNENAESAVLRLFNFITKTPEFHLI